jgi:hypothetical protein
VGINEGASVHADDIGSRAAGVLFVVIGSLLTIWAWRSARSDGQYGLKAAIIGPTVFVLGMGLLIHGKASQLQATRLTRIYGGRGLATIANSYLPGSSRGR